MKKFAVVALCGVLLLQLQGVAAQTQAQINTIMQQIATGTWLPPVRAPTTPNDDSLRVRNRIRLHIWSISAVVALCPIC